MRKFVVAALLASSALYCATGAHAQAERITTFKQMFGHDIGEDYFLASYSQLEAYWKRLATESDRLKLVEIGKSSYGRSQYMMIVSSPENLKNLERYKGIARRLAQAKGLSDEEARGLAREGKAVIWIDGGMHGNEPEPSQALMRQVYEAAASNDAEWKRILDDVIILYGHDNPDGQELLANWYMRKPDPAKRTYDMFRGPEKLPELPQRYVGHDNNRDFYLVSQAESTNLSRVFFREWFPQIIYNQHQPGPLGAVVFTPPFRDPFNYRFDPLIMGQLGEIGQAMHSRLAAENKPGATMRGAQPYSTWYNGGERTVSYFHNAIGLLTEINGSPTPSQLPLVPEMQLPRNDAPYPIAPQLWHMKQANEYSLSLNRAVLDYASRNRERLLYNIYNMGRDAIAAGETDTWTTTPSDITALKDAAKGVRPQAIGGAMGFGLAVDAGLDRSILRAPEQRNPRGYVISAEQPDLPTAIRFLNSLIRSGVEVQRATAPFTVNGKSYPAGSFVVKSNQAYRAHVLDMFEPQDHPQDFSYPGGPPVSPYDVAGYTLAYQMGLKFDRVLDGFEGPFQLVPDEIAVPTGTVLGSGQAGWLVSHAPNNTFTLTNRLMKAGVPAFWLKEEASAGGVSLGRGALWVPRSDKAAEIVERGARELGLTAHAIQQSPGGDQIALRPVRVAIADLYGGVMTTGWTQWIFENFELPYTVVFPQRLDAGDLRKDFDVVILPDDTFTLKPPGGEAETNPLAELPDGQPLAADIPEKYRPRLGKITAEKTVPALKAFVEGGGTAITIGSSTALASYLGLPVTSSLVEDGKPLPRTKFYVPGSVVTADVDNTKPLGYGLPPKVDLFYDNSPVFRVSAPTKRVAWFSGKNVVRSGWAWHPEYLEGGAAIVDENLGRGKVIMMGPEVAMRAQTQGAFKLLFNSIYYGPASARDAPPQRR